MAISKGGGQTKQPAAVALSYPTKESEDPKKTQRVAVPFRDVPLLLLSSALTFAATVSAFLYTMPTSVAGGDAAELARSACSGAVPHPPGYPLWTLLLRSVWTAWLGVAGTAAASSPITVFHAVACVCSAAAAAFLTATNFVVLSSVRSRLSVSSIAVFSSSVFGSLQFFFSTTPWRYAVESEVFALHTALMSCILLISAVIIVHRRANAVTFSLLAFTSSLSLCNQHTSLFTLLPLYVCLILRHYGHLHLHFAVPSLLLGASPYLYTIYASMNHIQHSWGGSLDTPSAFLRHLLRREYGTFRLAGTNAEVDPTIYRLVSYTSNLWSETAGLTIVTTSIGVISLWRTRKQYQKLVVEFFLFLGIAYTFYIVVFHYMANISVTNNRFSLAVLARFWLQPNLLLSPFVALGWCILWQAVAAFSRIAMPTATALLMVLLTLHGGHTRRTNGLLTDYITQVMQTMPLNAMVLAGDDLHFNTMTYLQVCEGARPDLVVLSSAMMTWPWFTESQARHYPTIEFPAAVLHPFKPDGYLLSDLLDLNTGIDVLVCGQLPSWKGYDGSVGGTYRRWPFGVCDKIQKEELAPVNRTEILEMAWENIPSLPRFSEDPYPEDSWEFYVYNVTWAHQAALFDSIGPHLANGDSSTLELAKRMADQLLQTGAAADAEHVWHAAIVYGLYSASVRRSAELDMYKALRRLLALQPQHEVAATIVRQRVNPYRNNEPIEFHPERHETKTFGHEEL